MKKLIFICLLIIGISVYAVDTKSTVKELFYEQNLYTLSQVVEKDNVLTIILSDGINAIASDYTFLSTIGEKSGFLNFKLIEKGKKDNEVNVYESKKDMRIEKIVEKNGNSVIEVNYKLINKGSTLTNEDFKVWYKKRFFTLKESVTELINELGIKDNEIDTQVVSENIYSYQIMSIKGKGINLTALNDSDEMSITGIEVIKTIRDIKIGDSYEKLLAKYGKENISIEIKNNKIEPEKIYFVGNKELRFIFRNNKISQIFIILNNQYQKMYR